MRVKITTKDLVVVFVVVTMIFDNAHAAPGKFIITDVCITKRVTFNIFEQFRNRYPFWYMQHPGTTEEKRNPFSYPQYAYRSPMFTIADESEGEL